MSAGTREIKVGLFVFIAFILLTVMIFSISDFYTAQPHYTLRVQFSYANGIQSGAPVRLSGVTVGEIRSIRIYRDESSQKNYAEMGILISNQAMIEEDAVAYINTLGLIGEKYLEIVPGTPGSRLLQSGEMLRGKDSVPTEKLIESGFKVVSKLEETISSINKVVGDPDNQDAWKGSSAELKALLQNANAILSAIRKGEGTVGRLIMQDEIYKDVQATVADVKAHPWKLLHKGKD